jgi:transposase
MGNPAGVKRDFDALERRRMAAMRLLRKDLNQSEVARRLKVSHQTVSRWAQVAATEGTKGLAQAGRAGRKPQLSAKDIRRLEAQLQKGPEALGYATPLWTAQRVRRLIERDFQVRYHAGHVWKILRRLGWSCQRPEGRARERNEPAIRHWKKVQWPAIKKKPSSKAAPSSSSTRAE